MKVPFLDLKRQYESIKDEIDAAIGQVIEKTAFAGGPFVKKFEEEFADYCGCKYAAGVNSGTSAIWLALLGLGIGKGDDVITVPNTFIATAEAICYASPVQRASRHRSAPRRARSARTPSPPPARRPQLQGDRAWQWAWIDTVGNKPIGVSGLHIGRPAILSGTRQSCKIEERL